MAPCLFGRRAIRGDHLHLLHCERRLSAGWRAAGIRSGTFLGARDSHRVPDMLAQLSGITGKLIGFAGAIGERETPAGARKTPLDGLLGISSRCLCAGLRIEWCGWWRALR